MLEEGARESKLHFGVHNMRSQGDSQEKTLNEKSRNAFLNRVVVTTIGHIIEGLREELECN
jgi:hypothetical protein